MGKYLFVLFADLNKRVITSKKNYLFIIKQSLGANYCLNLC